MCSKTLNIRPQIEDELGQGGKDDRQHFHEVAGTADGPRDFC